MRTTLARFALLATLLCTSNLARAEDRGAAAGAVVGGVAGALLGGPIGAAIGAGIGTVAGGAVTSPAAMQMVLPAEEAEAPVVQTTCLEDTRGNRTCRKKWIELLTRP